MLERQNKVLRIAVLDLYEGQPNEGMQNIRDILDLYCLRHQLEYIRDEFEVRIGAEVPGLEYDIYISTGGPGSPLDSEGSDWERRYFGWIRQVEEFNMDRRNPHKKHVLFICHSFQLACRYFNVANVAKRRSSAFGVFPVHILDEGKNEPIFRGLNDTFYAIDNRDYQVIQPDYEKLDRLGASVLAIEKERPHVPLERAVMAIRFNEYMLGTQFHPEVAPLSLAAYLQREDKKEMVIENYGIGKWQSMIEQLNDPRKVGWTHTHVIPNFLDQALFSSSSLK